MNLILDIGNSTTKMAIYDGLERITSFRTKEFSCEKLEKKLSPYKINKTIISSTRVVPGYIIDILAVNIPFVHVLSHKSRLPFTIEYETPETLGTDRIAAVAGACNIFPASEVLIIDAGTAITFDFLSAGNFKGGSISPGLTMRFKALHKFTGRLPLVSPTDNLAFPGRNTNDAITSGVVTGIIFEINEYIHMFAEKYTDFKVVLTGGDSGYLNNKINYPLSYMPDIVIDGLNYILEYNAE